MRKLILFIVLWLVCFIWLINKANAKIEIIPVKNISGSEAEFSIRVQAVLAGIDQEDAVRIAKCESNLNPLAKNKYSSASGVYQFIDSTWADYCEGNVFNQSDNIKCFMELYKKYPTWWVCR